MALYSTALYFTTLYLLNCTVMYCIPIMTRQGSTVKYSPTSQEVTKGKAQGNSLGEVVYSTVYPKVICNMDSI